MKKRRGILQWGAVILIAAACLFFLVGVRAYHGADMAPALKDGDLLILYKQGVWRTGDVVCYKEADGSRKVARIHKKEEDGYELVLDAEPQETFYVEKDQVTAKVIFLFRIRGI